MFVKLLIVSLVLVAFVVLALGVKLWFDPDAEFSSHSCALDNGNPDEKGTCSKCQLKELDNYPEMLDKGDA